MADGSMPPSALARPRTRGDCIDGPRPCPWASCRFNLRIEVKHDEIRQNSATDEEGELLETCSLDVADRGPHGHREIGKFFGLSHERIRQIEEKALATMAKRGAELREYSDEGPVGKRRLPVLQGERP